MILYEVNKIITKDRLRDLDEDHVEDLMQSIRDNGLMQPIVVRSYDNPTLVAGEHRREAFSRLSKEDPQFSKIPTIDFHEFLVEQGKLQPDEELSPGDYIRYEVEENVRRLSMSWQDRALSIYKYHKLSKQDAGGKGETWSQSQTGELLGLGQSYISKVLLVAKRLKAEPNGEVANADSLLTAFKILLTEQKEKASKEHLKRLQERRQSISKQPQGIKEELDNMTVKPPESDDEEASTDVSELFDKDMLYSLYYKGDALDVLKTISQAGPIHHIITDPPYGIDMDNLFQKNISRIVDTHKVPENIQLLTAFLQVAYDVIDPRGFLCMWYDLDHHEKLQTMAKKIGWKVCRWPFVWCKSSSCGNQAAAYNFTKSTEVCMILRRSEESVLVNKQGNNFIVCPAKNDTGHPFHKPGVLWERLIDAVSYTGQTVVDPFAGSGSMLATALLMERSPIGVELDPSLIEEGVNWMHTHLNSASMFSEPLI